MAPKMMKAIRFHEFGGPEVLQYDDVPVPAPQPGEVRIRVHAVGVNPPDSYLRDGYVHQQLPADMRPTVPLPAIPGSDVSGVVDAVGPGVREFAVGDGVFGMLRFPSFGESAAYAEYVTAPTSDLASKPPEVDHAHAAAAPMSALTAWQFLIELGHDHPNPLQPQTHRPVPLDGRTVLINGAAGGVGHVAVQLAKSQGARVIAVASTVHETFLRHLGADVFVDYTKNAPEDVVRDVDLVLDTIGGPATSRFLTTLRRGGALFPVFPGFTDATSAADLGITVSMTQVRSDGVQLTEIGRRLASHTLRMAIDSTFALPDARSSHERADRGHVQGKIVLTVG